MKYFAYEGDYFTYFVATPGAGKQALKVSFLEGKAIGIELTFSYPDWNKRNVIQVGDFYRAFVDASNQLYAHFRDKAGDVFPIPVVLLEPGSTDQSRAAP